MDDLIKTFENTEFGSIRTVEEDGKVLFCGNDVAKALGYSDTPKAIKTHCREDGWAIYPVIDNLGREQQAKFITEGNVYRLITHSKLPSAEKFESWVFDEVLPAIRKTGEYKTKKSQSNPEIAKMRADAMMLNAKSRIAKQMMAVWTAAGVEPQYQALALNGYYEGLEVPRIAFKNDATALYDQTTIAKHLGVYSKSGKPHAQAVGAIIEKLQPLSADEWAMTPYSRNGHDDESIQYTESVERKVSDWLKKEHYPTVIAGNGKNYTVQYRHN